MEVIARLKCSAIAEAETLACASSGVLAIFGGALECLMHGDFRFVCLKIIPLVQNQFWDLSRIQRRNFANTSKLHVASIVYVLTSFDPHAIHILSFNPPLHPLSSTSHGQRNAHRPQQDQAPAPNLHPDSSSDAHAPPHSQYVCSVGAEAKGSVEK